MLSYGFQLHTVHMNLGLILICTPFVKEGEIEEALEEGRKQGREIK